MWGTGVARWLAPVGMCTAVNHRPASLDPRWVTTWFLGDKPSHPHTKVLLKPTVPLHSPTNNHNQKF